MSRNEILLRIEELVKKLDEQQQRLQTFGGEIPALESDLLQRQVRQLYEYALELEKCRTEILPAAEPVLAAPATVAEVPVAETPPEPVPPPPAATPPVHESPAEHILVEAAKRTEPVSGVAPAAGIKGPKMKGEVNAVLFKDNPTIGDRFEDEPTIHERIASAHTGSSIASHQQRKPISSLKKAVGLNEKFLFINQLFDGNLQVYNQAIDFLDAATEKETALSYMSDTLIPQFGWDVQGQTFRMFAELVERRYLK
jgi:hypothetical protein